MVQKNRSKEFIKKSKSYNADFLDAQRGKIGRTKYTVDRIPLT